MRPWSSGFSTGFGPLGGEITNTTIYLQLPINCVLAGEQNWKPGPIIRDVRDPDIKSGSSMSASKVYNLSGSTSFSTKTGRGYD